MKTNRNLYVMVLAAMVLVIGCAREDQMPEPVSSEPLCRQTGPKELIMQVSEDILRRMQFVIEKNDLESGLLRTRPLRGGQFFEFWRSDNAGVGASAEANMHSLGRTVQINVYQGSDGMWCIKCDARVQRLSIPQRDIHGFARAPGTFTDSDTSLQTLKLETDELTWIDLGPDAGLEGKILERIINKIGGSVSGERL